MSENSERTPINSRRDFLKLLITGGVLGLIGSVIYPLFAYLIPPKQVDVEVSSISAGKAAEFAQQKSKIIRFGSKPVIVINTGGKEFKAFSATCTHLDCTVQYKQEQGVLWCACHNGKYDLNGKNISGPPPRPLDAYRVVLKGDDVLISKNA